VEHEQRLAIGGDIGPRERWCPRWRLDRAVGSRLPIIEIFFGLPGVEAGLIRLLSGGRPRCC
jgi:hypothetical protein